MFTLTNNMFLRRDGEGTPLSEFTFTRETAAGVSLVPFDEIEGIAEAFIGTPEAASLSFEDHIWFAHQIMIPETD